MSVLSFLNDLGIIPNEGTGLENDSNLLQGQKYMEYGRVYKKSVEPHLKNLQMTSMPNVTSVIEGMKAVKSSSAISKSEISMNENEFNKTMIEYSATYKQLSDHGQIQHNNQHIRESNVKQLNIKLLKKLENLNKKLISLSEQIVKEVERDAEAHRTANKHNRYNRHNRHNIDEVNTRHEVNTIHEDNTREDLHRKINEKKKNFNEYIHKLKLEQQNFNKDYMDTLTGQEESSKFNVVSNLYLLALLILFIFIIIFVFIKVQTSSSSNTDMLLIVLILLLGAFYIKNNYY
jgi:hypothetical protein